MTKGMYITLHTHPGVVLNDPTVTVIAVIDRPQDRTFQPSIILTDGPRIAIHYELPVFPYVNGSWDDDDVHAAVSAHLLTLQA